MKNVIWFMTAVLMLVGIPSVLHADDADLLHDYALDLSRKGDHTKALENLQKAYNLFPLDVTLKKNLAATYILVGKQLMEENHYDEAAERFDQARDMFPDEPYYSLLRGIALYAAKRYDASIYDLNRAGAGGE